MVIKRGDTFPRVDDVVLDELGNPVNVTNAVVKFSMRYSRSPTTKPLDGETGGVSNGPAGGIYYQWLSGDTEPLTLGAYEGEFQVSGVAGGPYRVPTSGYIPIVVEDRVSTTQ